MYPDTTADRQGVVVIRLWTEHDGDGLRARMTFVADVGGSESETRAAAGREAILAAVGELLEEFGRGR